tara:strand:- start:43106 stop:44593 length:1488 start_codon:yes stop_codon:yes gene_type:complete
MAVELKSGAGSDLQTVDAVSKAARVTLYNSDGIEGTKEIPVAITCFPVTAQDNDIISSTDVTEYKSISLQLTGVWAGTVTFQGSNDNGTFYDIVAQDATSLTTPYNSETTANGLYNIPVVYKYFRARVTAFTSGTVNCTAYGHKEDKSLNSVGQIGVVTLAAETTKVIGTVNVSTGVSYVAGTITASDTALAAPTHDGSLLTGTPSVNSFFAAPGNSALSTWVVEIAGTLGGASFYFEGSTGSTDGIDENWVSLTSLQRGLTGSPLSYFATTEGEFTGNATGLSYFRVRAVGGVGVNVTVGLNFSRGAIAVNFNAPIPAGANVIGSIDNLAKIGGVAVSMGSGLVDAGTQRVSIGTDDPVSLAAGANFVGKVAVVADPNVTLLTDFYAALAGAVDVNSRVIRGQACVLSTIVMTNYAATARHVKIYDTAVAPVAGVGVPVIVLSMPAAGTIGYPLPASGLAFANGIGMTMVQGAANNNAIGTATAPDISLTSIFT